MVGRIIYRREKGKSGLALEYIGPLSVMTATLWEPEGLSPRRLERRLARVERTLARQGIGRVALPDGFPYGGRLKRLRPVETLPFYRAVADMLALGALDRAGVPRSAGRIALSAPWLCPELAGAAERLCAQVRELVIDVPAEGEDYACLLHERYGLPVMPREAPADVTAAFGPGGGAARGITLRLYGAEAELDGLEVTAPGLELPRDCTRPLLALLWEAGCIDRAGLRVENGPNICPQALENGNGL